MDFCEGPDDVGPIRDEVQGGCSTRESVFGMVPSANVDLEGRVRFFRTFHRPQQCLFVSLQFVWRLISLQGSQDCAMNFQIVASSRYGLEDPYQHIPDYSCLIFFATALTVYDFFFFKKKKKKEEEQELVTIRDPVKLLNDDGSRKRGAPCVISQDTSRKRPL